MKFIIFISILLCFISCDKNNSDTNNIYACQEYEYRLKIIDSIKNSFINVDSEAFKMVIEIQSLSGIRGDGPLISSFGFLYVSDQDIQKWTQWYNENKQNLKWNDEFSFFYPIEN